MAIERNERQQQDILSQDMETNGSNDISVGIRYQAALAFQLNQFVNTHRNVPNNPGIIDLTQRRSRRKLISDIAEHQRAIDDNLQIRLLPPVTS